MRIIRLRFLNQHRALLEVEASVSTVGVEQKEKKVKVG